jgi:serine/threonine protein kinase
MKKKIGTGKFSVVYQAIEKSTGNKCAIKVIESYKLDSEEKNLIAYIIYITQPLNQHHEDVFSPFTGPV